MDADVGYGYFLIVRMPSRLQTLCWTRMCLCIVFYDLDSPVTLARLSAGPGLWPTSVPVGCAISILS